MESSFWPVQLDLPVTGFKSNENSIISTREADFGPDPRFYSYNKDQVKNKPAKVKKKKPAPK